VTAMMKVLLCPSSGAPNSTSKIGVKTDRTGVELAKDKMSINLIATAGFKAGASVILALAVQAPAQLYCYVACDNRFRKATFWFPMTRIQRPVAIGRYSPDSTRRSTGRRVTQVTSCG
jgi:hypothetical protein